MRKTWHLGVTLKLSDKERYQRLLEATGAHGPSAVVRGALALYEHMLNMPGFHPDELIGEKLKEEGRHS